MLRGGNARRWGLPVATILLVALLFSACQESGSDDPVELTIPPSPEALEDETAVEDLADAPTGVERELAAEDAATSTPAESTATPMATSSPTAPPPTSTPSPTPVPTPTSTPEPTPTVVLPTPTVAEGGVAIVDVVYDPPVGRDQDGELTYVQNLGGTPVDLTNWTISDIANHIFTFPAYVLQPGATVRVHICTGEPAPDILYWGHCSAVWNNEGDTITLYDATGRAISVYSY